MPTLPFSDCHLSYIEAGQGRVLLFVHGFPLDHSMWRYQIAEFATSHRVLAVDLPGFGQSSPNSGSMSIIGFADRLAEFLDRQGVTEKVILCGLSMGGSIALQFALRHGSRLERLILCDCRATIDPPEARQMRYDLAERVMQDGAEFVAQAMPARLFAPRNLEQQPEIIASVQSVIRSTARESVAGGSRALADRDDVVPHLSRISSPTLIIVGAEDVISTVQEMRQMAERIPAATLVEIQGAGHMAPLESPTSVNHAIRTWLSDTAP